MIRRGSAIDELTAPLGLSRTPPRRSRLTRTLAVGLGALLLAGGALWFVASKGLLRGKPTAAAPAPQAQAPAAKPAADADPTGSIRSSPEGAGRRTVTIIDGMSGKRQEVPIGASEPAPGAAPSQRPR
jgi:uncharacterized protein